MKIQQELVEAKLKGISLLEKIKATIQLLEGSPVQPIQVLVSDNVEMLKNRIKDNRPGDSSWTGTLDELVWTMTPPKAVVVPPSRSLGRKGINTSCRPNQLKAISFSYMLDSICRLKFFYSFFSSWGIINRNRLCDFY